MSYDYVQAVVKDGTTYFYLRPPKHLLRLGWSRIKLEAATGEEAARLAAEFMANAPSMPVPLNTSRLDLIEERLDRIETLLTDIARKLNENGR